MTMNKGATTLALALILSACGPTSIRGLQERAPVLVEDSPREAMAIIACVSTTWLKLGGPVPKTVSRENGVMLVLGDTIPMLLVETTSISAGTHVVMHQFKTLWSDDDRHRIEEVRACL